MKTSSLHPRVRRALAGAMTLTFATFSPLQTGTKCLLAFLAVAGAAAPSAHAQHGSDDSADSDHDGKTNGTDDDVDGDGIKNGEDDDTDGDGIPNGTGA